MAHSTSKLMISDLPPGWAVAKLRMLGKLKCSQRTSPADTVFWPRGPLPWGLTVLCLAVGDHSHTVWPTSQAPWHLLQGQRGLRGRETSCACRPPPPSSCTSHLLGATGNPHALTFPKSTVCSGITNMIERWSACHSVHEGTAS